MDDFAADLNKVLKYDASSGDVDNLLHQLSYDHNHQQPGSVHRLVTADALQEHGRDAEAHLLRSEHPVYMWRGKVFRRTVMPHQEGEFYRGYLRSALWASMDDNGNSLDDTYDARHIAEHTDDEMAGDAVHFLNSHSHLLPADALYQAGTDFWLSRNGHGTGYFDRPEVYGDETDALQKAAGAAGEYSLNPEPDGPDAPDDTKPVRTKLVGYGGTSKHWGQPEGLHNG